MFWLLTSVLVSSQLYRNHLFFLPHFTVKN
jgi:hypothetical protein